MAKLKQRTRIYFYNKWIARYWKGRCVVCEERGNENFECQRCEQIVCFNCLKHGSAVEIVEEIICKPCYNHDY